MDNVCRKVKNGDQIFTYYEMCWGWKPMGTIFFFENQELIKQLY